MTRLEKDLDAKWAHVDSDTRLVGHDTSDDVLELSADALDSAHLADRPELVTRHNV